MTYAKESLDIKEKIDALTLQNWNKYVINITVSRNKVSKIKNPYQKLIGGDFSIT
jgi:hypothetical protein